ncbi:hypothetical protein VTK73DRAFT_1546 [Phialemonium thermophilum]|uniref:SnoaL-like domain-containing protein n=1 Tax=Phialemonium thermophilum TaxID=223376 RepID=A0ABR3X905_9PEZI
MFAPSSTPAPPLPEPRFSEVQPSILLLPPLSRRGQGPGLIVLCPEVEDPLAIVDGVPWVLVKWAEEGYAVIGIQPRALVDASASLRHALEALSACDGCTSDKIGIVSYGAELWNSLASAVQATKEIVATVVYADATEQAQIARSPIPILQHLAGTSTTGDGRSIERSSAEGITRYWYPSRTSFRFAVPFQEDFHYATEAVSHTRSLTFLKPLMQGPYFDLETIWDEHTYYEFEDRSVEHTMSTMVQEPYVNHIPTMTGGVGRTRLSNFYRHHFIFNNSPDTELELISRTVGIDRVVDEFIYKFTHNSYVDWMLPGIPPTGKKVEVPFTAIVNIRGDRLYHEHIAWDQACALAQLDLLPEYLPFPYPIPGNGVDEKTEPGKYEYRLPVAGIETARKLRERNAVPSNQMFDFRIRERKPTPE